MFVYADNAATTSVSKTALNAMMPYLTEQYGNPSSLYAFGQQAKEGLEAARKTVAECINAEPREIYFTSGGSEADNQAIVSAAKAGARKGKRHLISTAFEHHAVLHTLKKLEKEGFEVTLLDVHEDGVVRLEDLEAAAEVLTGKKVAPFVKLIVTPASRKIYREALDNGTLGILMEAGAIITHPACGLCCGRAGGILTDNEVVVATNNRNFLGRMGTSKVQIYLASPKTAAACAAAGKIVVPE